MFYEFTSLTFYYRLSPPTAVGQPTKAASAPTTASPNLQPTPPTKTEAEMEPTPSRLSTTNESFYYIDQNDNYTFTFANISFVNIVLLHYNTFLRIFSCCTVYFCVL